MMCSPRRFAYTIGGIDLAAVDSTMDYLKRYRERMKDVETMSVHDREELFSTPCVTGAAEGEPDSDPRMRGRVLALQAIVVPDASFDRTKHRTDFIKAAIFPGGTVRAITRTMETYFASLAEHGTTAPFRERMLDFKGIYAVIGTDALLEEGARYA